MSARTNSSNRTEENVNETKGLPRLPKHVVRDGVKWLMVPSKVILDSLSVWPERQTRLCNVLHVICVASSVFFLFGQFLYISDKEVDLGSLAYAISIIIVSLGTTIRRLLCYFYKKRLNKILHNLYFDFWPSNITGPKMHRNLSMWSRFLSLYCTTTMCFASLWGVQAMILPIFNGNLPLSTKYPFEWWKSPYYGLLYVWEAFMSIELVFNICGLDLFFVSLLLNCVSQFKLLRVFLKQQFKAATEAISNPDTNGNNVTPMQVLIFCIERHKKLIGEIEDVFSYFILIQFLASIGSVCLSSFVATAVPQELGTSLTYGIGHVCEIFIYCFMGENLIIESSKLADAVYECGWHLSHVAGDKEIQKTIAMVMVRSQRSVRLSAGGFGYLSLSSFMKLAQFSFSVYTFLKKMMRNQHLSNT